jgi:hypothetical protein
MYYPGISLELLRRATKILSHGSQGVGTAMGYELDDRDSIPEKGK